MQHAGQPLFATELSHVGPPRNSAAASFSRSGSRGFAAAPVRRSVARNWSCGRADGLSAEQI
jgi:hypothetical protein